MRMAIAHLGVLEWQAACAGSKASEASSVTIAAVLTRGAIGVVYKGVCVKKLPRGHEKSSRENALITKSFPGTVPAVSAGILRGTTAGVGRSRVG